MKAWERASAVLFDHLGLKLASLACSTALWALLASQDMSERTVGVPFNARHDTLNQPAGTTVIPAGRSPVSVAVRVRGRRSRLRTLDENKLRVRLDLRGAELGRVFSPPLRADAPLGFAVIDLNPVAVRVRVETVIQSER
jgi:hypothetical protein